MENLLQDLIKQNQEFSKRIIRLKAALQSIADEDFRGNRPQSAVAAFNVLQNDLEYDKK